MKKPVRKAGSMGKDRYVEFNSKSNAANKLMDKAFSDSKPRKGTTVGQRIALKSAAWGLYGEGSKALREERTLKKAGKRMATAQKMQAANKAKIKK